MSKYLLVLTEPNHAGVTRNYKTAKDALDMAMAITVQAIEKRLASTVQVIDLQPVPAVRLVSYEVRR